MGGRRPRCSSDETMHNYTFAQIFFKEMVIYDTMLVGVWVIHFDTAANPRLGQNLEHRRMA